MHAFFSSILCRYRNDVQFATYRKWRKAIRTVTLRRPDMWRPVKVAIDDEVDLPLFFHAEIVDDIYKLGWDKVTRVEDRKTGRRSRQCVTTPVLKTPLVML